MLVLGSRFSYIIADEGFSYATLRQGCCIRKYAPFLIRVTFTGSDFTNAGLRSENQNHAVLRVTTQFFQAYVGRIDEYVRTER